MQSTQRSESMNFLLKSGYTDNSTAIHDFAKSFYEVLSHMHEKEANEDFHGQSVRILHTAYGFDEQLSRMYTRPVYNRFRSNLKSNTTFNIQEDTSRESGNYLVRHRKVDTEFPWIDHSFRVKAVYDTNFPEWSTFECECKTLEHTDLFCPHLICAFTHLGVERIPSKYVLRRFTRYAMEETSFDRHDMVYSGPGGDTKARRTRTILTDLFKLQRSAVMSNQAMEKARSIIAVAIIELDRIPPDLVLPNGNNTSNRPDGGAATTSTTVNNSTVAETPRVNEQEIELVSPSAPPVSTTKGCRKNKTIAEGVPEPHFQRGKVKKRRRCGKCGVYSIGHNASTCDRAQEQKGKPVVKRPRGRLRGTRKCTAEKMITAVEGEAVPARERRAHRGGQYKESSSDEEIEETDPSDEDGLSE